MMENTLDKDSITIRDQQTSIIIKVCMGNTFYLSVKLNGQFGYVD